MMMAVSAEHVVRFSQCLTRAMQSRTRNNQLTSVTRQANTTYNIFNTFDM